MDSSDKNTNALASMPLTTNQTPLAASENSKAPVHACAMDNPSRSNTENSSCPLARKRSALMVFAKSTGLTFSQVKFPDRSSAHR